jgi:hypothetical protein
MNRDIAAPFFALLLFAAGCRQNASEFSIAEKTITDSVTLIKLPEASQFSGLEINISNPSDSPAIFYLTPASIDFRNYETLIAGIIKPAMSDEEKAIALWKFTSSWAVLGIPPARNQQPCDPLKLFNSLEYALCGGTNGALANLFSLAGLKSRVYNLQGHVVAEVFYQQAWHMFDADRNVFFTGEKGEIASVEYISKHPEIIEGQKERIRNWGGFDFSYKVLQRVYSSAQNNRVNSWFKEIALDYRNEIILRKDDNISFNLEKTNRSDRLKSLLGHHSFPAYNCTGVLKRNIHCNFDSIPTRQIILKEELPYAVTSLQLYRNNKANRNTPISVYYSADRRSWYFKGILYKETDRINFPAVNTQNEAGVFSYYLKLVGNSTTACDVIAESNFLFSDKVFMNGDNSFRLVCMKQNNNPEVKLRISGIGKRDINQER